MADEFAMYGPQASGARLVDLDRIKAAEQFGQMSLIPYKQEELRTQAEMRRAQTAVYQQTARKAELEARQEEQFIQLIKQAQGQADQESNVLEIGDRVADAAAGAGMINKGIAIADKVAGVRQKMAARDASLANAELRLLEGRSKRVNALTSLMSDGQGNLAIQTPEDWAAANQLYSIRTGEPSPWAGVPFAAVPGLFNSAMSVKEQTDEAIKRSGQEATKRYRDSRLAQHDAQQSVREARQRLNEEREERLKKDGGGKAVTGPNSAEVKQAEALIKRDLPAMGADDREEAAYAIASDARVLRNKNKALGAETALNQAFQAARASGQFQTTEKFPGGQFLQDKLGISKGVQTRLDRQGRTPEAALAQPKDLTELKAGRYYQNSQGQVGRWDGKKMTPVNPPALQGDNRGAPSTPADEEGEDE